MATAVSAIRLEKPHSLSYQDMTRHEGAVHDLGLVHVEDRRMRVVVEVRRHQLLLGVAEDALELALRRCPDRAVDLLDAGRALRHELEVHDRHVRRRHPDRHAVELAVELGQHEAHRLGRAGRRRDHRERGGAGAVEVLVHRVERRLVAGVAVDRGHEALVDPDRLVQHIRDRREAVRRAGGVGDDEVVLGQGLVVDAEDDGLVRTRSPAPRRSPAWSRSRGAAPPSPGR